MSAITLRRHIRPRYLLIVGLVFFVALAAGPQRCSAEDFYPGNPPDELIANRIALVVGVSNYQFPLRNLGPNPINDAVSVNHFLRDKVHFTTELLTDPSRNQLLDGLKRFTAVASKNQGLLLFYFAGHGLTVNGLGYIVPQDAIAADPIDAEDRMVSLDRIFRAIHDAHPRDAIIVLDACRNDPFSGKELAGFTTGQPHDVEKTLGTYRDPILVAFSTVDGGIASNGATDHSPYTEAFLASAEKSQDIELVLRQVRTALAGRQLNQTTPVLALLMGDVRLMSTQENYNDEMKEYAKSKNASASLDFFMRAWPVGYFYARAQKDYAVLIQKETIRDIHAWKIGYTFAGDTSNFWLSSGEVKSAEISGDAFAQKLGVTRAPNWGYNAGADWFYGDADELLRGGTPVIVRTTGENNLKVITTKTGGVLITGNSLDLSYKQSREALIPVSELGPDESALEASTNKLLESKHSRVVLQAIFSRAASLEMTKRTLLAGIQVIQKLEEKGILPTDIATTAPVRIGAISQIKLSWLP